MAAATTAANSYGTPLYLYDLARLRADAAAIRDAFSDPWLRLYAIKANGLPPLISEVAMLGFGATAVSSGEVGLALRAGLAPAEIALEGIGKTERDLELVAAMAADGKPPLWVSLESPEDAAALAAALRHSSFSGGRRRARGHVDALVRVNPQVAPETVRGLAVGAPSSKFGVLAEELPSVIEAGGGPDGLIRWRGIHLHVGSQLGAVDAWRSALRVGLRLLELQRAELTDFDTLDTGGGFPVAYEGEDSSVPSPNRFAAEAQAALDDLPASARPARMAIEPGRAIVAGCGWLIGRVLHVRQRQPQIVVLDAAMTDLIRPALYGAVHPMAALTSHGGPIDDAAPMTPVRVDGAVCESTDTFGTTALPPLERGDLVAIGMAGAYGSSMFSTYNGRPRPAEVAWDGDKLRVLRRRGRTSSLP